MLQARTVVFDRAVVNALERDVLQVAIVGAGYDGRSHRYAKAVSVKARRSTAARRRSRRPRFRLW